jgi:hypothetical protein
MSHKVLVRSYRHFRIRVVEQARGFTAYVTKTTGENRYRPFLKFGPYRARSSALAVAISAAEVGFLDSYSVRKTALAHPAVNYSDPPETPSEGPAESFPALAELVG